tara:strand:- start:4471 stop:6402 length:1932 start_codon:yes stop_codon:yes gene_type:complete
MDINIYGAGITGLTVAHELINKGYNVNIYEKDDIIGGMARSTRTKLNVPSEHSWRGYGPFYKNLYEILKQIPIDDLCSINKDLIEDFKNSKVYSISEISKHNTLNDGWVYLYGIVYDITEFIKMHPGGSVIEKSLGKDLEEVWEETGVSWHKNNKLVNEYLSKYKIGITEDFKETFSKIESNKNKNYSVFDNLNLEKLSFENGLLNNKKSKKGISYYNIPYLYYLFGKVALSNNRLNHYFEERLEPFLKKNVSTQTYNYIANFLSGPGYGFDKNTISLGHYGYFIELNYYENFKLWSVMNKPTNEAWFDYWKIYLENKGVKFYLNHEVHKINYDNTKITNIEIKNKNNLIKINNGLHIICINPFIYQKILEKSNINNKLTKTIEQYKKINIINNQISFRLGFNKNIKLKKNNAYVLIDSPYNITFYPYEKHWCKNVDLGLNNQLKSLWSGTLILTYNNGSLTNKSATSLNKDELLEEIKYQFMESEDLLNLIKKYNDGYILKKEDFIYGEIFEDWEYINNRLISKNPKFVDNFISEKYKPDNITKFDNLYIGGSHTKTSVRIWSMEGAVESGKIVANKILSKHNKELCNHYIHKSSNYLKIFKCIDDVLYQFNLPHLIDFLIYLLIIYIIFKITRKYIIKKNI